MLLQFAGEMMHLVIFGLTVSSSWGNGHATLWRSLIRAALRHGHTLQFYEQDLPYYRDTRDLDQLPDGAELVLYRELSDVGERARRDLDDADLAICTSYCPDGPAASELIIESRAGIRAFYDMDTPVTLDAFRSGRAVDYLPADGLKRFDLVLSFTGGRALDELRTRLGARVVAPLYGSVDLASHRPVASRADMEAALSYLGTYARDRQKVLDRLFFDTARALPKEGFLLGGAQYPHTESFPANVRWLPHVPPPEHPEFFCSSRATLNVTRGVMAHYGFCPQGRLFEAAACGVPLLSDAWEGLDTFFEPGGELIVVNSVNDVVDALALSSIELKRLADAARARVMHEHTGDSRILELEQICNRVRNSATEVA